MRFADIEGHEAVKERLRAMVDADCVPHNLMLEGMPGIGKMKMARAFIQYMNCSHRADGDSCGVCPTCRQISALSFPDINYVFPVIKRKDYEISDDFLSVWTEYLNTHPYPAPETWTQVIRKDKSQPAIHVSESAEILRKAYLTPYSARRKVILIWQPEKMILQTANKLLKIMEEPEADTMFLLVSNSPDDIIETIRSRTQRVAMQRLPDSAVARTLISEFGIGEQTAVATARLSGGSVIKALEMSASETETAEFLSVFIDVMRHAYAVNGAELKRDSERLHEFGREKGARALEYFASMVRENFIMNVGNPELNRMSESEAAFSERFHPFISQRNVEGISREIDRARTDLLRNANGKVLYFDLMLKLAALLRPKK